MDDTPAGVGTQQYKENDDMAENQRKITLKDRRFSPLTEGFIVKSLVNSIDYQIGDILKPESVKALCHNPTWTVTVVEE